MIDALMLLGENRFGRTLTVDEARTLADELGLDGIVAAAAASAGRIIPLGRIDPLEGDRAVREAERCIRELSCAGLFLHPGEEAFPVRLARPVVEAAAGMGVPVVIATGHFSLSEPLQIAELARDVPDIPVVMTNGGQINISGLSMVDAWLALTSTPNLHVLTNGEYRQDFIERLATELDHRRVLYASFAPVFDPRFELARIRSARLGDAARAAMEHDNAERLFGQARR